MPLTTRRSARPAIACFRPAASCLLACLAVMGCGDDNATDVPLVTIQGTVRSADSGAPLRGARVGIFETSYAMNAPTGEDGRFTLRIPRGTPLIIYVDDFDNAVTDTLFPLINWEVPTPVANASDPEWATHGCPRAVAPQLGSVAVWDQYLAQADDTDYGDLFAPASSAQSSGVLSMLIWGCNGGVFQDNTGFRVTTTSPSFPIGYGKAEYLDVVPDPALGPALLLPGGEATDRNGWVLSFGDPAYDRDTVTVMVADTVSSRHIAHASPVTVPVRPGTITMIAFMSMNGEPGKGVEAILQCMGMLPSDGRFAGMTRRIP